MKTTGRSVYFYLLGALTIFVGYLPTIRVPVMGDDFFLQFEATGSTAGDFWSWQARNLNGAIHAGHFKPLGNLLDSIPQFLAYPLSAFFGVSTRFFYFAEGLLLLVLIVFAASWFAKLALKIFADVDMEKANVFLSTSLVTGLTIQIHPWSNDPVTTYLATGMVAAAMSFSILGLALKTLENSSKGFQNSYAWLSAVVGVCGVLQYEMNLAAIVGAGSLIFIYSWQRSSVKIFFDGKFWLIAFTNVMIPTVVFLLGRLLSASISPDSEGYTGTQFQLSTVGVATLTFALISTLPGGAWFTSFQGLPAMTVHWPMIVILFASALTSLLVMMRLRTSDRSQIRINRIKIPALVLMVVAVLSSASHAFTPKYQFEINSPGKVYLSYMLGAMCVNVVLSMLILVFFSSSRSKKQSSLLVVSALVISFGMAQQVINWGLGSLSSSAYSNNTAMSNATTTKGLSEFDRCQTLSNWAAQSWPDYYRQGVIDYSQSAYKLFHDDEFCSSIQK